MTTQDMTTRDTAAGVGRRQTQFELANEGLPAPLPHGAHIEPQVALDDASLGYGPYTQQQVDDGMVSLEDYAAVYGTVYLPERFTSLSGDPSGAGVCGTSRSHTGENGGGYMPWCRTRERAVAYLKRYGYYGQVIEYALDAKTLRGQYRDVIMAYGSDPVSMPYSPHVVVGTTDVVNAPSATEYHGHVLGHGGVPAMHVRGQE